MNRRLLGLVSGAAAGLGVVAGLLSSPTPEPSGTEALPQDWQLPGAASLLRHDAANLEALGLFPWKGGTRAEATAAAVPTWYLRGIVEDPVPTALVDDGQGKILRFKTGDVLPNGASLVRIGANRIEFETDGCVTGLDLHRDPASVGGQANPCTSNTPGIPGSIP